MAGEALDPVLWGVVGGMLSGYLAPIQAPATSLAKRWEKDWDTRWDRILTTAGRAERKRGDREEPITERTAIHALREAAVTDDVLVQEYLAGVVASASVEEDNAHLLALVSRLTPFHLRLHYDLYRGAFDCLRTILQHESWPPNVPRNDVLEQVTVCRNQPFAVRLDSDFYDPEDLDGRVATRIMLGMQHLRREEVIASAAKPEAVEAVVTGDGGHHVWFRMSPYGMSFFRTALGIGPPTFIGYDVLHVPEEALSLEPPLPVMNTRLLPRGFDPNEVTDAFKMPVVAEGQDPSQVWRAVVSDNRTTRGTPTFGSVDWDEVRWGARDS